MKILSAAAGAFLTAGMFASMASAATVTATFEGDVVDANGFSPAAIGTQMVVTLIGEDDAVGSMSIPVPTEIDVSGGAIESFALTSLGISVASIGLDAVATNARIWVGDNTTVAGVIYDTIFAQGMVGDLLLQFVVGLSPDKFSGTDLDLAVQQGLAQANSEFEFGNVIGPNTPGNVGLLANTGITGLISIDPDPDPDPGNGGGTGGGGGTPGLTPVPLPASGLLLIGGVAAFGAMRRKRA
ncbi:MAG: VPLPA-CTERM sorting domain-containing protein [Pseudomonadota bacterium]